jgi:hypothetical protein
MEKMPHTDWKEWINGREEALKSLRSKSGRMSSMWSLQNWVAAR